ncbi:MAG: nitrite/sulfite reductase [Actinomycetota bacterium]|nr:nitrite/sulfite reductase [Actinomycetota bacterium]
MPDIPAAKRAGLPVDLDRLTTDGDDWLTPEERYALKTHGVCAQAQPGAFMIRVRTGGRITTSQARGLAALSEGYGRGWLHLTTRQQLELHHVEARQVTTVLSAITDLALTTRSACGHTIRGVMWCPDAGVSLDEPFDCSSDAVSLAAALLARTPELDTRLPSRLNFHFGGCAACREHAKVNDAGFVSMLDADGRPGYQLWIGGSLGKSLPTLAIPAVDFLPRDHVVAAGTALVDVYVAHGDFDRPNKARLKFLIRDLGASQFLGLFHQAYTRALAQTQPPTLHFEVLAPVDLARVVAQAPEGGWSSGVRPQRAPGRALVTVAVPLGDLDVEDLRGLADLADRFADGHLYPTRNQNLTLREVTLQHVPTLRERLRAIGLLLDGADQAGDVRACTGGPVCALAITPAQQVAADLLSSPALARNSHLRVHLSGCPNACAQHQIADIGFSGGKVSIGGRQALGYQVWLGGDLQESRVGSVVGRIAHQDVAAIIEAIVGLWEALRQRGETFAETAVRLGIESFAAHIGRVFQGRWEAGPEPEPLATAALHPDRTLPLALAS